MKKVPNTTYLLAVAQYKQKWGWWWYTPPLWKSKAPPPLEESGFLGFVLDLLASNGVSTPRVVCLFRSNAPREAVGYKGVVTCEVYDDHLKVLKTYSEVKGVPKASNLGDFWFKRREGPPPIRVDIAYFDTVDPDARRPDAREGGRAVSADSLYVTATPKATGFQAMPTL